MTKLKKVSLKSFFEDDTTSFTLREATKTTAAVVINGATKASAEWNRAKSKFNVKEEIRAEDNGKTIVLEVGIPLNEKKALAFLVTSIEGLSEGDITDTDEIKEIFTNPRAETIVIAWNKHLNSLGNEDEL